MEAHDEQRGAAVRLPVPLHVRRQRGEIRGVVMEALEHRHAPGQPIGDARGRAFGVLRVERNDERLGEIVETCLDAGLPVPHRVAHRDAELLLQKRRLPYRVHRERRAFGHPDLRVLFRRALGARSENNAVKDR